MMKLAQYYSQKRSMLDSIGDSFATPLGLALGLGATGYLGKSLWQGSPGLRASAAVGLPVALYHYLKLNNPENLLKQQAQTSKAFHQKLQADPDSVYYDHELINQIHKMKMQKLMQQHSSPMQSALGKALPAFALGAALPAALRLAGRG